MLHVFYDGELNLRHFYTISHKFRMESQYQNMNQREAHALHPCAEGAHALHPPCANSVLLHMLLHEYKPYMEFEFLMYKSDILMIDEGLGVQRFSICL